MKLAVNGLWPRGLRHSVQDAGHTDVGRCLALCGSVGQRAFAHDWNVQGKYGRRALPLPSEERVVLSELIVGPCISAEAVKACVLIGLAHDG